MKKFIYALLAVLLVITAFTNVYATRLTNSTLMVTPYSDTSDVMDSTMDSLSVGIIVASIVIFAGVVFFYLIPKE